MKVLCMYPGKYGRNIASILDMPIIEGWVIINNPHNEETRHMYILTPFRRDVRPADVPISRIRILTEDDAYAIKLCIEPAVRQTLLEDMRKDIK